MPEPAAPRRESRLLVTANERPGERLSEPLLAGALAEPALPLLVALAARAACPERLFLYGGEPTLRADLPALVREVRGATGHAVGLYSDGLAFRAAEQAEPLVRAGVERVRLRLHSARLDAHDWLSGIPGSGARVLRAIKVFRALGVRVELEALVTRPNAPYLGELVRLGAELGVAEFQFRRLVLTPRLANDAVALGARFGLCEAYFEDAGRTARDQRVALAFEGFPPCTLGSAHTLAAPEPEWLVAPAWPHDARRPAPPEPAVRCHGCDCAGAPSDYISRFGAWEFLSERLPPGSPPPARAPRPAPGDDVVAPPPRGLRSPGTRLRVARALAERAELGGDPLVERGVVEPRSVLRVRWRGGTRLVPSVSEEASKAPEPTRGIRQRLVAAAQYGARRLRVVGESVLTHPEAPDLLTELTRLSVPELELAAEGSALSDLPDAALAKLAGFNRVEVPLFGVDDAGHNAAVLSPDAFARTLAGVERLARVAPGRVGVFGVLAEASLASEFAAAWARGALPGEPRFRLAARGGSLDELATVVRRLEQGPSRAALERLLPLCARADGAAVARDAGEPDTAAWGLEFTRGAEPLPASVCDPRGDFAPCGCGAAGCPGSARGWSRSAIGAT
jgi:molybdenum cofactor biosynthesis enzyme MoaA